MAKRQTRNNAPAGVEVLDAAPASDLAVAREELGLTPEVGGAITSFIRDLALFFGRAKELEVKADSTLMAARALKAPKSGAEDEVIQRFIKKAAAEVDVVEEHWKITTLVHNLHRRLTGRRKLAVDKLEQARTIAQTLHNRYVEDEKRRAAEEEARQRREAEERARKEREAELAELERKALREEAAREDLSEREQNFVRLIVLWGPAACGRAARESGYKNAETVGAQLLARPKIAKALEAEQRAKELREQKQLIAELPLEVEEVEVKPDISRAAGAVDRTTWSAELVDERALIMAAIAGQVPTDILTVDRVKLNTHARSLKELINKWPGVRAKKQTTTV